MGDDIWSGGFFGTKSTGNTYQIKYADYDGPSDYFVCDSCLGDVIFRNYIYQSVENAIVEMFK